MPRYLRDPICRNGSRILRVDEDLIYVANVAAKRQKYSKQAIDLNGSISKRQRRGIYSAAQLILLPNGWQSGYVKVPSSSVFGDYYTQ